MYQTKIYITTDSSSPKATEKHYGYVLECMWGGEAKTREGFGKVMGTYHQAVLTALAEALDRFNQSCEVCICTEDEFCPQYAGAQPGDLGGKRISDQ